MPPTISAGPLTEPTSAVRVNPPQGLAARVTVPTLVLPGKVPENELSRERKQMPRGVRGMVDELSSSSRVTRVICSGELVAVVPPTSVATLWIDHVPLR